MAKAKETSNFTAATNRKARAKYDIGETFEAGMELAGCEVKSMRLKQLVIDNAFALVTNGEVFLHNLHITPYAFDTVSKLDPDRTRRLLLKKREIKRLLGQTQIKGNSLIPLEIYFKNGWAKVKLGLGTGKKTADRRDDIKKRDLQREVRRDFRENLKA